MKDLVGPTDEVQSLAQQAVRRLHGRTLAAAESITGGSLAAALAAADNASDWFKGSVVAYSRDAKYSVLGVDPGPVITAGCARQMAANVATVLAADVAVATTGAGGPGAEEDQPPGTVFIAVATRHDCRVNHYRFDGEPPEVVHKATIQALRDLTAVLSDTGTRDASASLQNAGSVGGSARR